MVMRRASPRLGRASRNLVRASGREPRGRVYRNRPRENTRRGGTVTVSAIGEVRGGSGRSSGWRYAPWRNEFYPAGLEWRRATPGSGPNSSA